MSRGRGLLFLDFDGVIAPDSVDVIVSFVTRFIEAIRPVDRDFLRSFVASTVAFPPDATVPYLFEGLGISSHIPRFMKEFRKFDRDPDNGIVIDPGFYGFMAHCKTRGYDWRILSLATPERLARIGGLDEGRIVSVKGAKADPDFFRKVAKLTGAAPGRSVVLDDNPLAVNASRLAGFHTVWMRRNVVPGSGGGSFAHAVTRSWSGFIRIVNGWEREGLFVK